tara:strand:- start:247 stop:549 length:303 start_codon:yes stop_codon:yes gene_type:complete
LEPQQSEEEDRVGAIRGFFKDEETAVEEFFAPKIKGPVKSTAPKPTHYKVVSISLYQEDIARLEALVSGLKAKGHTRANKSMVIREALRQLDLESVPKQL